VKKAVLKIAHLYSYTSNTYLQKLKELNRKQAKARSATQLHKRISKKFPKM